MSDGPFEMYIHKPTEVQARKVRKNKVIHIDDSGNDIVVYEGEYEIIDGDGTIYKNTARKFEKNYTKK